MSRYFEHVTPLSGKAAMIIGASDCVGEGIAKCLAADGAAIAINHVSGRDRAERLVTKVKAKGGKALAIEGDVANAADIERMFVEAKQAFGRLDIIVNNAGVFVQMPLNQAMEEDFHRYFNRNVLGLLLSIHEAAKLFGGEGGSVFNVNCLVSDFNPQNSVYYTATKLAIDSVNRALASDLIVKKIRVNSIEVAVQLVRRGIELLRKDVATEFVERILVDELSIGIRTWALHLESGRINILLRRDYSAP